MPYSTGSLQIMTSLFPKDLSLPTLDKLEATSLDNVNALDQARSFFAPFARALEAEDASTLASLFVEDSYWRDMLSLTWDYRTFHSRDRISQFLSDRLPIMALKNLRLDESTPAFEKPYYDLAWIQAFFSFESAIGPASGIFRLVPVKGKEWKAHTVFTVLEGLHGVTEQTGPARDSLPNHGLWVEKRKREIECEDEPPRVIIIGAGKLF